MSNVETIQKPKRVYKKKVVEKVIEPVIEPVVEPEPVVEQPIVEANSPEGRHQTAKPKRVYKKKVVEKVVEPTPEPTPEPIPAPSPETSSDEDAPAPVKEKRPRTEKQIAAFNRMREARIKKQAELEHLKEVAKHQTMINKEQKKLEKVEDQIIKKKAARKPQATSSEAGLAPERRKKEVVEEYLEQYISEPESFKVPTLKPILFM